MSSASLYLWVDRRLRSHRAAMTGYISTALGCRIARRFDSCLEDLSGVFSAARSLCIEIRSDSRRASRIGVFSSALVTCVAMRSASRLESRRGVVSPALRALFLPCLDEDALCAAKKSLVLFVLQYVPAQFADALQSEIQFAAPSDSCTGSTCLMTCFSVRFTLLRSSGPCSRVSVLPSCLCYVFIRWSRSHHFFSARRASVISVSAAREDASARGPLYIAMSRSKQSSKV